MTQNNYYRTDFLILIKEFAKEYSKKSAVPLEIIVVGGSAVVLKYDFRPSSEDFDVEFAFKDSYVKECINKVADKHEVKSNWINDSFLNTSSYSPKLKVVSKYFGTFYKVAVRIIDREYLCAMKLMSFRQHKHDKSDIVGIIADEKKNNTPIKIEDIKNAYMVLYNQDIPPNKLNFLQKIYSEKNIEKYYREINEEETKIRATLINEVKNGTVLNESNIESVVELIKKKISNQ